MTISTTDMLAGLVAFNTTSAKSNLPIIDFIDTYLTGFGVEANHILNNDGTKANLLATIGPQEAPGVVLSGHTDVVPVAGQQWKTDPFQTVEKAGRIYGRGTADMKGFLAAVLSAVPHMVDMPLNAPIHLAFSYDEEVGGLGARDLAPAIASLPARPRFCVVGEPTGMQVVTAHKGIGTYTAQIRGLERHSSLAPQGVNAVEYAARLIVFIQDLGRDLGVKGPFDAGYTVPHTTVHVGTVQGGTALNIVPGFCTFEFEIRNLPDEDAGPLLTHIEEYAAVLEKQMHEVDPRTGIEITSNVYLPGLSTPQDSEVVSWATRLLGRADTGKVAYGSEAGLFSEAGIPSVLVGPGDIAQAHQADEFVSLEQLTLADRFVAGVVAWAASEQG